MKVTYNWLKDFVDIRISPKALADKLSLAGLEVTSVEERQGDFVFEIEVTSNRPDCLSVMGIAREVAAITNSKFKIQNSKLQCKTQNFKKEIYFLKINIENKKDCPFYTAKIIQGVQVGPSPAWLKKRLELVGCHSVNNVVDITNYILFSWGQPLHAFDLDKIIHLSVSLPNNRLKIIVRRAKKEEEIITLDGRRCSLDEDILVIASGQDTQQSHALALAGIMGGKYAEVNPETKNILLESAVFNPLRVRQARQKLGLQSESAYRCERGIDFIRVEFSAWQAVRLIQKVCAGKCILTKSSSLSQPTKKSISFDVKSVDRILGIKLSTIKIKRILDSLGFQVRPRTKNNFTIKIPSHRLDVNLEIDLIEEIARIFGLGQIPSSQPVVKPQLITADTRSLVSLIKNILVGLGLNEAITYSLMDKELLKKIETKQAQSAVEILNPLSKEQGILRPTLIPSLLRCVSSNLNQKQGYVNIFEVAHIFRCSAVQPQEERVLGIALCGIKSFFVFGQGLVREEAGILHLKGILEVLFGRLGIKDFRFQALLNPGEFRVCVDNKEIGVLVQLPKMVLERLDIKHKIAVVAELSLDNLFSYVNLKKNFVPLAVYPSISRDISFMAKDNTCVNDILEMVKEKGQPLLQEVKIIDFYQGRHIPAGFRGLSITCIYRSKERTLTEAEINPVNLEICEALKDRFSAQIR